MADNNNLSDTWFLTILFVGNMIQSRINLGTGCCAGDLTFYGEVWWFRDADMRWELSQKLGFQFKRIKKGFLNIFILILPSIYDFKPFWKKTQLEILTALNKYYFLAGPCAFKVQRATQQHIWRKLVTKYFCNWWNIFNFHILGLSALCWKLYRTDPNPGKLSTLV